MEEEEWGGRERDMRLVEERITRDRRLNVAAVVLKTCEASHKS